MKVSVKRMTDAQLPPVILVVMIVIAGAGWWWFLKPAYREYQDVRQRGIPELMNQKERMEGFVRKAKRIDGQLKQINRNDQLKLEEAVPSMFDVPDIVTNMEALATVSGLSMGSVGMTDGGGGGGAGASNTLPPRVTTAGVSMSVSGINYLKFKELLGRLVTNSRIIDVPAISFSTGIDAIQLNITMYAYSPPQ